MKTSGDSPITMADRWFAGEDQAFRFTIYDHDPLTLTDPPSVKDITGWTIQFRMAITEAGASVLTKSATLTTPASGICTVATLAGDTSGLTPGTYYYALSRTDAGLNQVLASGSAVLRGRPV